MFHSVSTTYCGLMTEPSPRLYCRQSRLRQPSMVSHHWPRAAASGRALASRIMEISSVSTSLTSPTMRSEEHTSELQSQSNLVCRLLLEKKKKKIKTEQRSKHCYDGMVTCH